MNIERVQFNYPSSNDADQLYVTSWIPETPRATIQIVHGMSEHMGRYDTVASFFAQQGFAVFGNDLLGHGRTAPAKEDKGFFGASKGVDYIVEDVYRLGHDFAEKYRGLPRFLLGHSMGSFIARIYITRYRGDELSGCILSGTADRPGARFARIIAWFLAKRFGQRHRSKFLNDLVHGKYNDRFSDENDRFSWLSRDKSTRKAYIADEYTNYIFTVGAMYDLFQMLTEISNSAWRKSVPKSLPILMITGEEDPVSKYGKSVRKLHKHLQSLGLEDLTSNMYAECRHELFNEINKYDIFNDVLTWLEDRMPDQAPI